MYRRHATTLIVLTAAIATSVNAHGTRQAAKAPSRPPAQTVSPAASKAPADAPDIVRAQFIQAIDADYRGRDLNGDGKVVRSEVEQTERASALDKARASNRALFVSLDSDRNGALSRDEFSAMVKPPTFTDVSPIMQRFDLNKDQVITLVEYRTAALANFDRLDVDKDGVLTGSEAKSLVDKPAMQGR